MSGDATTVQLILPVHNVAGTLERFHTALTTVLASHQWQSTVCYIDDGSTDDTWSWIVATARKDARVSGLRLARNVGQTGAVAAGFASADADVVVTLDADLDYSPAEVPRFVEAVLSGHDLAVGARRYPARLPLSRRVPSALLNTTLRWAGGYRLGDVGCGFIAVGPALRSAVSDTGNRRRAMRPALGALAANPATLGVLYRTSGRRDPVTSYRQVGTALDILAAIPRVRQRLAIGSVASAALAVSVARLRHPVWRVALLVSAAFLGGTAATLGRRAGRWSRRGAVPMFEIAETVGTDRFERGSIGWVTDPAPAP